MLFITANHRLALHIAHEYHTLQQAAGLQTWETLPCMPLSQWIEENYHTLPNPPLLLNTHQEYLVWEEIITNTPLESPQAAFFSSQGLAKMAQRAWHLMVQWNVPLEKLIGEPLPEVLAFYQWATVFQKKCADNHWIDHSQCVHYLIPYLSSQQIPLPPQITLFGFEEISPQTQHVFDTLSAHCTVRHHPPDTPYFEHASRPASTPTQIERTGFENEETEWTAMAQWALHTHTTHPHKRIGCVVPQLSQVRPRLETLFSTLFGTQNPFNLSGGTPLDQCALLQTAFDIFQLIPATPLSASYPHKISLDVVLLSRLLNSPFIGGALAEASARAQLDFLILSAQSPYIEWKEMLSLAEKIPCPIWIHLCQIYQTHFHKMARSQPIHLWQYDFTKLLSTMGWPGERTPTSTEYQHMTRWSTLLEEWAALESVMDKPISHPEALYELKRLTKATLFQPETTHSSAVQVLGLLEAVGILFDALWVSGLHQSAWPAPASPNPFIPLSLQRRLQMPHASPERELQYSQTLTQRFCKSAEYIVFSYSKQKEEDTLLLPSPLIQHFPEKEYRAPMPPPSAQSIEKKVSLEHYEEIGAPPFNPQRERRPGGAYVLKYQALCPFKAFATFRLQARPLPKAVTALTLPMRGVLLHRVLEKIWRTLKDSATLHTLSASGKLPPLIASAVHEALQETAQKYPFLLIPALMKLEQARLGAFMQKWLEWEKERPAFKINRLEQSQEIHFAGLTFQLRIDREDGLEDGTRIIIDYKTGMCDPKEWLGERPNDPQLPLYALTQGESIPTITFAHLSGQHMGFKGLSHTELGIPGILPCETYQQTQQDWHVFWEQQHKTLSRLAIAFQQGQAFVDPKEGENTCRLCELGPLCRIRERTLT